MADLQDDMYPNSGEYFQPPTEPKSRERLRDKERAQVLQARPLIDAVVERLQQRIVFYSSIDSISVSIDTDPATFQKIHAANGLVRDALLSEKEALESLLSEI